MMEILDENKWIRILQQIKECQSFLHMQFVLIEMKNNQQKKWSDIFVTGHLFTFLAFFLTS